MTNGSQAYSLLEFTQQIKKVVQEDLGQLYWVVAEISEMKIHASGHCYMELVEKKDEKILAKIRATIWSSSFYQMAPWFESQTGEKLRAGLKILSQVRISFHEVYGLSMNIQQIDPSYTIGERARKRQEIVDRLIAEDLLEKNSGLGLSLVPQTIAIISSEQAAGYEDFIQQIRTNSFGYEIKYTLFPCLLQGNESAESIVAALSQIQERADEYDLICILRGGGSQLDLESFNSYSLAAGIAKSSLPVITGIGHERDETIADLVAWKKFKTPTAAAEFLIARIYSFEERLVTLFEDIKTETSQKITSSKTKFELYRQKLKNASIRIVERNSSIADQINSRLKFSLENFLIVHNHKLDILRSEIGKHDPKFILLKGYTMSTIEGVPLSQVKSIHSGQELKTESSNQIILSTINKTSPKNEK